MWVEEMADGYVNSKRTGAKTCFSSMPLRYVGIS